MSDRLTDIEIEELRRLDGAVARGWRCGWNKLSWPTTTKRMEAFVEHPKDFLSRRTICYMGMLDPDIPADAVEMELIVAMRNALPRILDELTDARAQLASVEAERDRLRAGIEQAIEGGASRADLEALLLCFAWRHRHAFTNSSENRS